MRNQKSILRFIGSVEGLLLGLAEAFGRHVELRAESHRQIAATSYCVLQLTVDAWLLCLAQDPPGRQVDGSSSSSRKPTKSRQWNHLLKREAAVCWPFVPLHGPSLSRLSHSLSPLEQSRRARAVTCRFTQGAGPLNATLPVAKSSSKEER